MSWTGDAAKTGFDQLAAGYDDDMRRQAAILDRFRRTLHAAYDRHVAPDATVLELGCGTGQETQYLAASGRAVIATDVSPEMLRHTRARLEAQGLSGRLRTELGRGPELIGRLAAEGVRVGAVVSSLGPLNCEPDLEGLGAALRSFLPAGAPLVLSPMGRYCPWEIAALGARGRFRQAVRRLHRGPVDVQVGTTRVPVWYFTPGEFKRRLGDGFRVLEVRGLGVFLPPPYLHRLEAVPGLLALLDRLDKEVAHRPVINAIGDHSLIVLARAPDQTF